MLSGEGNAEERWKAILVVISKKSNFERAAHLLYISLPLFCTRQRETSRNFFNSCTFYGGNVVRVLVHFFLLPLIFILHWWPLAFLILSPPLQNVHVVLPTTKNVSFVFFSLALFLIELRWPAAWLSLFLCLSPALYSKFVDMLDNESKLNTLDNTNTSLLALSVLYKTPVVMRFPAKITSSCIWVAIPVDWVILHWYAFGVDGRSLGRSLYGNVITKFSRMGRLLHCFIASRPRAPLLSRSLPGV